MEDEKEKKQLLTSGTDLTSQLGLHIITNWSDAYS